MITLTKLKDELITVAVLTAYFGSWLAALVLLKHLILAEYHIAAYGFSAALVGALVLSKVVLVLEHVSLGHWVRSQPAWVNVILRTALYSLGVLIVLVLEKTIDGSREYGGLATSLKHLFERADMIHVWLNTICLSAALLSYNILSVIRMRLGQGAVLRMFLEPLPKESG
jgi:hypothetical protein